MPDDNSRTRTTCSSTATTASRSTTTRCRGGGSTSSGRRSSSPSCTGLTFHGFGHRQGPDRRLRSRHGRRRARPTPSARPREPARRIGGAARGDDQGRVGSGEASRCSRQNCAACHRADAGGLIGPNLTDDYWLHGGDRSMDIHKTVHDGVLEKGDAGVGQDAEAATQVDAVAAYVNTLRGTNPAKRRRPRQARPGIAVSAPVASRARPADAEPGRNAALDPSEARRTALYATDVESVATRSCSSFFLLPHLRIGGKPLVLLDLAAPPVHALRHDVPSDRHAAADAARSRASSSAIFLLTALFGRVWCGWACPQTVYMEFLFRPDRALVEGGRSGSRELDKQRGHCIRDGCSSTRSTACSRCSSRTCSSRTSSAPSGSRSGCGARRASTRRRSLVMAGRRRSMLRSTSPGSASRCASSRARTAACSRCCSTGSR